MDNSKPLNCSAPQALELLLSRRSGSAKAMTDPGPSPEELQMILTAASRVPDHGKLFPWRFVVFEDEARAILTYLGSALYRCSGAQGSVRWVVPK